MTWKKTTLPWCLLLLCAASVASDELIVGPGETLRLEAPDATPLRGDGVRFEAALDGGPMMPVGRTLTAPAAGDHWLAVASRDGAGNLSKVRWIRLRVDGEAPHVDLRTEPAPVAGLWIPLGTEVEASAGDDLAGVDRLFLALRDEVREVSDHSVSLMLQSTGEAAPRAWAIDRVGNRTGESMLKLIVDSTPPAGDIRAACMPAAGVPAAGVPAAGAASVVVALDCRIEVEVSDGESGGARWSLQIDGEDAEPEVLEGPWPEGRHRVEVATVDAVGNEGHVGPFTFTADGTGPEIAWRVTTEGAAGTGGMTFYRPPVTVVVEATDSPAGLDRLQASTDGESYSPVEGPVEVDGDRLWLRATDRVGNASSAQASWRLDLEGPEIRLLTAGGESIAAGDTVKIERGEAVRFDTSDAGAGVDSSTYSLTVESAAIGRRWWWAPPSDEPLPEQLTFPWPGELALDVESVDRLGNRRAARWRVVVHRPGGGGS